MRYDRSELMQKRTNIQRGTYLISAPAGPTCRGDDGADARPASTGVSVPEIGQRMDALRGKLLTLAATLRKARQP